MDLTPSEIAVLLLGASAVGALLPLYRRWSERGLHLFVAVAAGIFLGTIFLHLLPHLAGFGEHGAVHVEGEHEGAIGPWIAALVGLLLLFGIEKVWLPSLGQNASANPHTVLWSATYVGLSLHALTAGFALSAVLDQPGSSTQLLVSLMIHKATETFSLATVMRLAQLSRTRMLVFLGLFAAIEPTGFLVGRGLLDQAPAFDSLLTGFACGTFLYVALCDLLPEVFHGHDRPRLKLVAVLVGIGITALTRPVLSTVFEFGGRAAHASFDVFLDLAPFLLLGLLVSGIVRLALKRVRLARKMAGDDLKSVLWAALFGAPLPLCSCSVVPVAVSLRRAGASKGATSAFAISTPETGIDSVAVSIVLLDPILAIARPIGAILSAVASGVAVNWLVRAKLDVPAETARFEPALAVAACDHDHGGGAGSHAHAHHDRALAAGPPQAHVVAVPRAGSNPPRGSSLHDTPHETHDELDSHGADDERGPRAPQGQHAAHGDEGLPAVAGPADGSSAITRVLRYAYVEMLDDLTVSLVLGVVLSGMIVAVLPAAIFESPIASGFPALLLMLVVGIPLYVCALTSTPIAAALIVKGLSPGAAFVFLLAGPATNAAALFMLSKVLGRRVVLVQVVALSIAVVALGWCVDRLYPWLERVPYARAGQAEGHELGVTSIVSAGVLAALMIASLVRTHGSKDLLRGLRDEPSPTAHGS